MGWGTGGGFTNVVEDSYPSTICHTCVASETLMLSKTDQEIVLHPIDALNAHVGLICGQCTGLQLPASAQVSGEGEEAAFWCCSTCVM